MELLKLVQQLRVDPLVYLKNVQGDLSCLESSCRSQTQFEYLASCAQSVELLSGALEALVECALVEDGKFVSTQTPINLKAFLERIALPHQMPLAERGGELVAEVAVEIPSAILLDDFHLKVILTNLMGFALNQYPDEVLIVAKPSAGETCEACLLIEIKCCGTNLSRFGIAEAEDSGFGALVARKLLQALEWHFEFQRLRDSTTVSLWVPFVSVASSAT